MAKSHPKVIRAILEALTEMKARIRTEEIFVKVTHSSDVAHL